MSFPSVLRFAIVDDVPSLHALIERGYRGDTARQGWTHEADLLRGQRTSTEELAALVARTDERILVRAEGRMLTACVQISDKKSGTVYLGLLCVDPALQAGGIGKEMLRAAEHEAVALFGAVRMEMTVIDSRAELIAYYRRRGYALTGETRPFPLVLDPPLRFVVLTKSLNAAR